MNIKKIRLFPFLLCLFMLLNSVYIHSSNIKGNIIDEKNRPIEFANITLFSAIDTVVVSTTFSDSSGFFELLNIHRGDYFLEISYLNYKKDSLLLSAFEDSVEIGTISLQPLANNLDLVTITANKPIYERKADRIIFNVENSVYSQGSDAMLALSKAPRVQINNNDIKIAGRGDAAVLINDRLIRMSGEELSQYLKSIPSNDIQKIEVIPNPPAKYDAQGAALINIVLKKNRKQGYNGSVSGNFQQHQYQGGRIGTTINFTKKKMSFNSSISDQINKGYREETHILKYSEQTWKDTAINPQLSNTFSGRMSMNIDINNNNTFGFNYTGSWSKVIWDKETINTRIRDNINATLIQSTKNEANSNRNFYNHNITAYYTLNIDTMGKKLDIGFDFFNSYRNINRNYTNATFNGNDSLLSQPIPQENTNGTQKSYIYTINADMEHPIKYGTWQYGTKFTYFYVRSNNEQSVLQPDNTYQLETTRSSNFSYKEFNEAIYGSFSKSFKNVELQAGIRIEFTQLKGMLHTTGETNNQQYIRPFPSLMIQYKKNDKHQINFSINSRIDRPAFWQLNPFRYYNTQYSYAEGNPYLQPQYSYNTSLEYVLKQNYSFSVYYNYTLNNSTQIQFTDTSNNTNFWQWEAKGRQMHDLGTFNQFYFSIKEKWQPTIAIDVFIDFLKSPYLYNNTKRTSWGMALTINNDFNFDKNGRLTGSLNYYFTPPAPRQELFMRMYNKIDIGIKAKLLKEKLLSLSFFANNILRSKQSNGYFINTTGQYSSFTNFYNDRVFTFSITYKFGNKNLKTINKQTDNENISRAK